MALGLYKSFHWLFLGKGVMVLAKLVLLPRNRRVARRVSRGMNRFS